MIMDWNAIISSCSYINILETEDQKSFQPLISNPSLKRFLVYSHLNQVHIIRTYNTLFVLRWCHSLQSLYEEGSRRKPRRKQVPRGQSLPMKLSVQARRRRRSRRSWKKQVARWYSKSGSSMSKLIGARTIHITSWDCGPKGSILG